MRYVKIRAYPGAGEDRVEKVDEDTFNVYVREGAERGAANRAITVLLRDYFREGNIRIQSGHTTRNKIFVIKE